MFQETDNGLLLTVRIVPNSSKNEIVKTENGIKIKITAQPVDGKANKALIEFLSKKIKIPKSAIEIVRGETSKEKTLLLKTDNVKKIEDIKSILEIRDEI